MGVEILYGGSADRAVMYDNTTDWAFGPVAYECEGCGHDAVQMLEHFQEWLGENGVGDARVYFPGELHTKWAEFYKALHDHS